MKKIGGCQRFFAYFCLVDILLLPYFRPLHMLFSMPLVLVWLVRHVHLLKHKADFYLLLGFLLAAAASVARGYFMDQSTLGANVTALAPCVFSMVYFLFFRYEIGWRQLRVKRVLCVYIGVAALFSLVYWLSPSAFFAMRTHWTLSGRAIVFETMLINRFTFLMSDPNSIGCVICSMLLYLFLCERLQTYQRLLLLGAAALIVLSTLSTTGVLMLLATLCTLGFFALRLKVKRRARAWYYVYFALTALVLCAAYAFMRRHVDLLQAALTRYGLNLESATLGGRTLKWRQALAGFRLTDYFFAGKGSALNGYNASVQPHNGHIHLVLSYGVLAYCAMGAVLFRKRRGIPWRQYLCILPLFVLFTINTLVGDYRALLCLSLMAALAAQRRVRLRAVLASEAPARGGVKEGFPPPAQNV